MRLCWCLVFLAVAALPSIKADEPELLRVPIRRLFCDWMCASKGDYLECNGDQALAGICGSDNRENCDNPTYCPERGSWHHAALCCSYRLNMAQAVAIH